MILAVQMARCMVFYGHLRIEALVYLDAPSETLPALSLHAGDAPITQTTAFIRRHDNGAFEMALDALIDREGFPARFEVSFRHDSSELVKPMEVVLEETVANQRKEALTWDCLRPAIAEITATGRRPVLLDLGGRPRSGNVYTDNLDSVDAVVFDIHAGEGVDVVGDAHELSRHFPSGHFDLVMCNSVFEHLLMPWKVAIELNAVMRVGGLCYIHTHQTVGLHDMPWDFWRFSNTAWHGLFNPRTGFEVVTTKMSYFNHIVTASWSEEYAGLEASGGFEASGVLVRKIGPTTLTWPVALTEAISTSYPQ